MKFLQSVLVFALLAMLTACSGDSNDPASPPPGCPSIAGTYDLTIKASSACQNLPSHALHRTYPVTVTQTNCSVTVNFEAGTVDKSTTVTGDIVAGALTLDVYIVDNRDAQSYLVDAVSQLSQQGNDWDGDLNGMIEGDGIQCQAADHELELHRK